jgi:hypothetical protein
MLIGRATMREVNNSEQILVECQWTRDVVGGGAVMKKRSLGFLVSREIAMQIKSND